MDTSLKGGCQINSAHFLSSRDRGKGGGGGFSKLAFFRKVHKMSIIFPVQNTIFLL